MSGRGRPDYELICELLMDGAQLWQTLIQGVVQGITEFLPISSKSHLILVGKLLERWFGTTATSAETIELIVGLHLGTLLATIVVYWQDLWSLRKRHRLLLNVIIGSIPVAVVGLAFKDWLEQTLVSPLLVGLGLFITANFLFWGQRLEISLLELDQMSWLHALAVGCFQTLALLPGISRSGSTIAGGLMVGLTRHAATTFSFLLSVPAVGGVVLLKGIALRHSNGLAIGQLLFGAVISFAVGIVALRFLIRIVTQRQLHWFAYYCLLLGTVVTAWQLWP
ncbi:MAG: undecaprenyl-diphosphate phosphatase [Planctomycetaceae bacterium]|nr:undecaprenyl-diphosphate phosphatase [Planctomycetaceae bacterium]